jgi:phospholipid transport system substrate-binding protein
MTAYRLLRPATALCLVLLASTAANADTASPRQVVESMQRAVLDSLATSREAMEADPERFYALVRRQLRPNFDLERAGRAILGPSWRTASEAERREFQQAFEDYLVTTYATTLRHVTAETLTVTGEPRQLDEEEVLLPVRLVLVDRQVIEAELRMRHSAAGWKIWDAGAGGSSLVRLYRGDIGTEAAAQGVAKVVTSLREAAARNRARDLERAHRDAARARPH